MTTAIVNSTLHNRLRYQKLTVFVLLSTVLHLVILSALRFPHPATKNTKQVISRVHIHRTGPPPAADIKTTQQSVHRPEKPPPAIAHQPERKQRTVKADESEQPEALKERVSSQPPAGKARQAISADKTPPGINVSPALSRRALLDSLSNNMAQRPADSLQNDLFVNRQQKQAQEEARRRLFYPSSDNVDETGTTVEQQTEIVDGYRFLERDGKCWLVPMDIGFDDLDTPLWAAYLNCNTAAKSALGERLEKWIKR